MVIIIIMILIIMICTMLTLTKTYTIMGKDLLNPKLLLAMVLAMEVMEDMGMDIIIMVIIIIIITVTTLGMDTTTVMRRYPTVRQLTSEDRNTIEGTFTYG